MSLFNPEPALKSFMGLLNLKASSAVKVPIGPTLGELGKGAWFGLCRTQPGHSPWTGTRTQPPPGCAWRCPHIVPVHVQAAVVVHGQDDGGVGDLALQLRQLLTKQWGLGESLGVTSLAPGPSGRQSCVCKVIFFCRSSRRGEYSR